MSRCLFLIDDKGESTGPERIANFWACLKPDESQHGPLPHNASPSASSERVGSQSLLQVIALEGATVESVALLPSPAKCCTAGSVRRAKPNAISAPLTKNCFPLLSRDCPFKSPSLESTARSATSPVYAAIHSFLPRPHRPPCNCTTRCAPSNCRRRSLGPHAPASLAGNIHAVLAG